MGKENVVDALHKKCITDLYEVSKDAKIWRVYHIYGDYEIPLNLFIDSNNMLSGVSADKARFYVGKVGEKGKNDTAPITLYFMDHDKGEDIPGYDVCHKEGLQSYFGYVSFFGDKAYLFGAYGDGLLPYISHDGRLGSVSLPASNGSLFSQIESLENSYLESSLRSFVYGNFLTSCLVEPELLPLVQTIRSLTSENGSYYSADELNGKGIENAHSYDLDGYVFCKK